MTLSGGTQGDVAPEDVDAVRALFERWMAAWNQRQAGEFAALFAEDGSTVGFDGSQMDGRAQIEAQIGRLFAGHQTGRYVGIAREVRLLAPGAALLRGVVGTVPHGQSELNPVVNAVVSIVAVKADEGWRIALLQNTPAQFHGRPEAVAALTEELRGLLGST